MSSFSVLRAPLFALRPARAARRRGFTMIELIAVIGIILVMSTIVVGAYNTIRRAVADSASTDALQRYILYARQTACVDAVETMVWITDVNKFVAVRRAGVVSAVDTGSRRPSYKGDAVSSTWVHDDYAEAMDMQSWTSEDDKDGEDVTMYQSLKVFNCTDEKMYSVEYPMWFSADDDSNIFGVDCSASDFKAGDEYGWVVLPEQTLPQGWAFKGSYSSDGDFDSSKAEDLAIIFDDTGVVSSGNKTITVLETSTGQEVTVSIDSNNGQITVKHKNK